MGNPLTASVQHLYIVVLDVVTALFLAASCVRFTRKYGGVRVAHRARQHLERWGNLLIGPNDSEVAQKLHLALCQLLVSLSKILGAVFFLRLLAIQWYQFRHEAYDLQSLDISYMIAYPVSLLCVVCQRAVRPSTLDAIYASNQLLLLLPPWLAPPADIKYVAAITLLPRFLAGLSAKRVALPLFGHCLHALLALKRLNGTEPFQAPADVLSQAAEVLGLFAGTLLVRRQLHQSVQLASELKSRQIELDTVSTLLLGFCDSVVELDEDLRLTEDSRQLSTTLLPEDTGTSHGLAGSDFLEFVCQEDRTAVQTSLKQAGQGPTLNARMLDSLGGGSIRVELLHAPFCDTLGRQHCLVGIREVPDADALAPLWSESSETSPRTPDATLVFDATDFDILDVSEGFQSLCESHIGHSMSFEGLSVFDLSRGTGPASFSRQLQSAVNAFSEAQSSPRQLWNLDLFGVLRVHAKVKFQVDHILETLVGCGNFSFITTSLRQRSPRSQTSKSENASSYSMIY